LICLTGFDRKGQRLRYRSLPLDGWLPPSHRAESLGEQGRGPRPQGTTGLYHVAIDYPERRDLAVALKRILDAGWQIGDGSDHGTHEAICLDDDEGNGLELAWDRDRSFWFKDGKVVFTREPMPWTDLLGELDDPTFDQYLPYLANFQ